MRCLALAEELRDAGTTVGFLCREHPGNLNGKLRARGFEVHPLPLDPAWRPRVGDGNGVREHQGGLGTTWENDACQVESILATAGKQDAIDWLIVDHYALDARWERRMRPYVGKIMAIDDLADRPHDCDLLLDQNFYRDMELRYEGLTPARCQKLLGPKYALLRKEFRLARQNLRQRIGAVNRILVFFAGADPTNETAKAVKAVQLLEKPEIAVDVVVAEMNQQRGHIHELTATTPNATFYCQPENVAELMAKADLSVGASGSTTWERCCLGLPTLVVPLAANQQAVARDLAEEGAVFLLGQLGSNLQVEDYRRNLEFLISNPPLLKHSSYRGGSLVDGKGTLRCVAALGSEFEVLLKKATHDDCRQLYEWRNAPQTRYYFNNPDPIKWEDHVQWFQQVVDRPDRILLIGYVDSDPVGVLRYDLRGCEAEVSIYLVPGKTGRGFGPALLREGNRYIQTDQPGVNRIVAQVLPENKASIRAFEKAHFRLSRQRFEFSCREPAGGHAT